MNPSPNTQQGRPLSARGPLRFASMVFATFTAVFGGSAWAQADGSGAPRTPPAEALAACKGMTSGQACSFSGQRGTVSGSCFTPKDDKPLACRPKDAPRGPAGVGAQTKP
jgi:hypothetical protein